MKPSEPSTHPPMLALSVEFDATADDVGAVAATRRAARDTEATIVQAARSGDRAAFARLHERYAPMVHGIALARVPPPDAADVVQEAFLHALERMRFLRDDGAFGPWIAAIARNLAIEFHRRGRVRRHDELIDQPAPAGRSGGDAATEKAMGVLELIRTLPETYAETLVLRLVEGLTGPQIAACVGMTHGSVRVNLTRGMQMLRERLGASQIRLEDTP